MAGTKVAPLKGKKLDRAIETAWGRLGWGVQVDIYDIGKIFREATEAYTAHPTMEALDASIMTSIVKYRKN